MKVFVIEDSPLVRMRLEELLGETPNVTLVGHVGQPSAVVEAVIDTRSDVVILGDQPGTGCRCEILPVQNNRV